MKPNKNIIFLDDHTLYSYSMGKLVNEKINKLQFTFFQNGNDAIEYVRVCLKSNKKIDMIISDINHPGLDGIKFSRKVRKMELGSKQHIPILILSFATPSHPILKKGIQDKIMDKFIPKHADSKIVVKYIRSIL
jgi:CheY-like chemotaxis protein